nr:MAG TPA: hypothetical protein [Caudoviricetes sp.]
MIVSIVYFFVKNKKLVLNEDQAEDRPSSSDKEESDH